MRMIYSLDAGFVRGIVRAHVLFVTKAQHRKLFLGIALGSDLGRL